MLCRSRDDRRQELRPLLVRLVELRRDPLRTCLWLFTLRGPTNNGALPKDLGRRLSTSKVHKRGGQRPHRWAAHD